MLRVKPYGDYMVCASGVDVTAAGDLWEIEAPTDAVVIITGIEYANTGSAHTDEILNHSFKRYTSDATNGTGGTTVTPQSVSSSGGPAAGSVAKRNNSTALTGGTLKQEDLLAMGALRTPTRPLINNKHIILSPGEIFLWTLNDTPTSTLTLSTSIYFSEIGG